MSDFTYRNNEFELDEALICADISLVLTVETVDGFGIKHDPVFTLSDAYQWHAATIRPVWLFPLMSAWVAANQTVLTEDYYSERRRAHEQAVFAAAQDRYSSRLAAE